MEQSTSGGKILNLEDKMDDLDSKLRAVEDSCDYQFTINKLSPLEPRSGDSIRRNVDFAPAITNS